jgi:acyl-CoA synthetase (AMP-forming)/AMP-acid ligase II
MKAGIYNRKTLGDLLITAAEQSPAHGIGFVRADGTWDFLTFPQLLSRVQSYAGGMRLNGLIPGSKVMIIMARNEDIVPILWGCFLAGIVPTILQPPVSFTEFNQPVRKIENVFRILEHPKVLLSAELYENFKSDAIPPGNLISIESLKKDMPGPEKVNILENDLAFIQFSSGSTGDPKGIMLTHKGILANIAAISLGIDLMDSDVAVNWMPLYHDMGLFGYHLCAVFAQCNLFMIEPVDFIKRPSLWLDIMDETRCTISGCPNFGQALLLRYLKNKEDKKWDLGSLKVILNGAEPISTRILKEFLDKLSVYGLKKEIMMPAYGMAEATLAITFSGLLQEPVITAFNRDKLQKERKGLPIASNPGDMIELVSVGKALSDIEIRILDEEGKIVADQAEGLIQIRGASVTPGYFNNPEETNSSFDGDWLITGDKGFFYEGNLYITGRVKDIIFVHGQNLYAHDLENLAAIYSDIPYGKVIAGGIFDPKKGKDQIILFLVGSPNQAMCKMFLDLRNFFRDTHGIGIDVFVPVRSNQVPRTSSGKIQRYKLLEDYRNGVFDESIAEIKKLIRDFS